MDNKYDLIVELPSYKKQYYWKIYYVYVLNLFRAMDNVKVTLSDKLRDFEDDNCFEIKINDINFLLNYNDNGKEVIKDDLIVLKFHFKKDDKGFPFPSVSYYDWDQYYHLSNNIDYSGVGFISYKQKFYGNVIKRRNKVKQLLNKEAQTNNKFILSNRFVNQIEYWMEASNVKVAIFVPSQNSLLDRAQLQYMGLGVATISPELPEIVPMYHKTVSMRPNIDYIKCKDDYSDLIELINKLAVDKLVDIGTTAKCKFQTCFTPSATKLWLINIINKIKKGVVSC